jgi:hypothetical protein
MPASPMLSRARAPSALLQGLTRKGSSLAFHGMKTVVNKPEGVV